MGNLLNTHENKLSFYFFIPVPLGSIPELAAKSCKEIKASEGQAVSGKYWLSSIKPNMAVLAYCDMETGGEFGQTSILAVKKFK